MKIFLICPVRNAPNLTEEERLEIAFYVSSLEKVGHQVHWPPRDREAVRNADEVHVWWYGESRGSLFDLGMALGLDKKIVLANPDKVKKLVEEENKKGIGKSFNKMLLRLTGS